MKTLFVAFFFTLTLAYGQSAQQVQEPVKTQLKEVLKSYLDLKNALVASNAKKSKDKAAELVSNIDKVDESKLEGNQKTIYVKAKSGLKSHAEEIAKSTSLDKQRENFGPLSDQLFEIVKSIKVSDSQIYHAYCPMANNDNGGYWISEKKEIANPYFGSSMLKCGEVKHTL
jgi:Cu(I)/Ag(I) efflux system membrane fusion protein